MKRRRVFYGWWILAAGMGVSWMYGTLFLYGFSAFFIPWRVTFGWSRALLGGVSGLARLEGGLVAPVAGWFIDKYGPRRMMFLGLGMMGIGFFALSQINSLLMLYVVFLGLLAAGSSFGTGRAVTVTLANWFIRHRGGVMGLQMAGIGLGGSSVFLFALVIATFGWRTGAIFAGLLTLGIGYPLAWVIRHKPEQMGLLPDGDQVTTVMGMAQAPGREKSTPQESRTANLPPGDIEEGGSASPQITKPRHFWLRDPRPEVDLTFWQALRTQAFWLMALTYAIWAAMPAVTTVHLAPFLADELGLNYVVALGALSSFAFASVFGRLGFGFLADHVNIRLLLGSLMAMQGAAIFLFSYIQSPGQIPFYVIILGLPYGGALPLRSVIQGYLFGRKEFGTIGGLLQFVDLPATVAAPVLVGWLADAVPGGYRIGFRIIAATLGVAAACVFMTRRPRSPLPTERTPLRFRLSRGR